MEIGMRSMGFLAAPAAASTRCETPLRPRRGVGLGGVAARTGGTVEGPAQRLAGILRAHVAELGLRLDIAAAAEADAAPGMQLTAMLRALLDGIVAERHAHGLLTREIRKLPPGERAELGQRCKRLAAALGEPLVEAFPALRGRSAEVRVLALSLFGMVSASGVWFRADGVVDTGGYARMLVGMAMGGARGLVGD